MDLRCRHKNHPDVFEGSPYEVASDRAARDDQVLNAVRRFVADTGRYPTQDAWAAAGMRPSERTVGRRYGSFQVAIEAAGAEPPG